MGLEEAISTYKPGLMPAVVERYEYDQNLMEWRVATKDGRNLKFWGILERCMPNGWPLLSTLGQLDRTLAVRPYEFKPCAPLKPVV